MRWLLIRLLRAYRFAISPLYGQVCRYWPTCSAYALEAVEVHGAARGSWLAARRVARCHPWAAGGVDKVPPRAGAPAPVDDDAVAIGTDPAADRARDTDLASPTWQTRHHSAGCCAHDRLVRQQGA